MAGIVKLLFELSVDSHEAATFLCEDADLFCHVGWTLAFRVAVEFRFTVGVVVLPIQAVGNHFFPACPSSSPVQNTASTMMTIVTNSVIICAHFLKSAFHKAKLQTLFVNLCL